MDLATLTLFLPACFALNMAPGPNNLLSVSNATRYGFRRACTAGIGPLSTAAASACRCASFSRRDGPDALRSIKPSGPAALNRTTQSRTICSPTPPIRAASLREPPS